MSSLNLLVATAAAVALVLSPIILVASPFLWLWYRRQVREARERGLETLPLFQARTVRNAAEAMIRGPEPERGWFQVAANVDRYVSRTRSPRIWRARLILLVLELVPLLDFRPTFSRMTPRARRAYVDRRLGTTRGLCGIAGMVRQLARLGYYSERDRSEAIGFIPMGERTLRQTRARVRSEEFATEPGEALPVGI